MESSRQNFVRSIAADVRVNSRFSVERQQTRHSLLLLMLLTLAVCSGIAHADIYRYVNADGVATFTNVRPQGRYEVVVRETPKQVETPAQVEAPNLVWKTRELAVRGYPSGTRARYARQILAAAQATRVDPALIHAVISAESGYNPSARSRAGAIGLMQLMPATAERYSVTDRWDPEQNIHGGTRYLRDLLVLFNNDLRLAIAAYNAGEEAVMKYGNRIPPYRETVQYVPRVMSFYKIYRTSL
jgi:soluble lytic murein transglycosylase-like protein